mmetsp:Transcript_34039/g.98105  ORF Transcript_34039/g.98105 Transcript_34039/m.98105 type:complete len:321 (+) Transcript_34039:1174-2136(+)
MWKARRRGSRTALTSTSSIFACSSECMRNCSPMKKNCHSFVPLCPGFEMLHSIRFDGGPPLGSESTFGKSSSYKCQNSTSGIWSVAPRIALRPSNECTYGSRGKVGKISSCCSFTASCSFGSSRTEGSFSSTLMSTTAGSALVARRNCLAVGGAGVADLSGVACDAELGDGQLGAPAASGESMSSTMIAAPQPPADVSLRLGVNRCRRPRCSASNRGSERSGSEGAGRTQRFAAGVSASSSPAAATSPQSDSLRFTALPVDCRGPGGHLSNLKARAASAAAAPAASAAAVAALSMSSSLWRLTSSFVYHTVINGGMAGLK